VKPFRTIYSEPVVDASLSQKCNFCLLRLLLTVCRHTYPLTPVPGFSFKSHSMDIQGGADGGSTL